MGILKVLLSCMVTAFCTDCDNTLVFYNDDAQATAGGTRGGYLRDDFSGTTGGRNTVTGGASQESFALVKLPASSGSGRVGHVHRETLLRLYEISKHVPVVCASGTVWPC
jgi:hypothetical protein